MYDLRDAKQAAIGAFSSVLFFYAIRQGDPVRLDPLIGGVIGLVWLYLLWSYKTNAPRGEHNTHYVFTLLISGAITATLSLWFGMSTTAELYSNAYFGSSAWIGLLMAMPIAMLFDRFNIENIMDRYYTRRQR